MGIGLRSSVKFKVKYQGHNFKKIAAFMFHKHVAIVLLTAFNRTT